MDTFFFILRKNNHQITFLHVYHHASMLNIWWFVMNWIACGHCECFNATSVSGASEFSSNTCLAPEGAELFRGKSVKAIGPENSLTWNTSHSFMFFKFRLRWAQRPGGMKTLDYLSVVHYIISNLLVSVPNGAD